ncbi:MAG TPA: alanine racemase [Candidatus Saccharimonadales bacterium]|nr:alanine racemase [Candidatus Saccharimonadales bacterium]
MLRKHAKNAIKHFSANNRYRTLNRIEINAQTLTRNVSLIQRKHPDFEIIPVLKGNAYGHGLEQVAQILNDAECHYLAVDGYFEAAKIRDITKHHILVMGYILPENVQLLDTKRCSFVAQDEHDLRAFGSLGKPVKIHLELNTGFNRLGIQPEELQTYLDTLKKFPNIKLEGVMTHLVDADNESDDSFDVKQQKIFDDCVKQILASGFNPKLIHIAQTAGSAKIQSKFANAIRLGIGQYGINPYTPKDSHYADLAGLKPPLELKSTIIKTIDLKAGETVGYNATFKVARPMRIGVLPLGFYEGLPRTLSNKGCATSDGQVLPIVGRICMNHTMIDLGQTNLKIGDEVTLISGDTFAPNSIISLQTKFNLFAYETLTGLSDSIRRIIV